MLPRFKCKQKKCIFWLVPQGIRYVPTLSIIMRRHVVDYKKEEIDALPPFFDHLAFGADFQARVKWDKNTVAVWDVSRAYARSWAVW